MCSGAQGSGVDFGSVWETVREQLRHKGIDLQCDRAADAEGTQVKVVCIAPGLKDSVQELGRTPRDQVVMVRVDEETSKALDAWVETGAVRSRSEAAALFIREGLQVRADELEQLKDALNGVEEAKRRLREKARQVFGDAE